MKKLKKSFVLFAVVPVNGSFINGTAGYLIGGIIAVVIMAYLVYSLLKPEKF
jgi:K+-transporting ATPase KdpF subunit